MQSNHDRRSRFLWFYKRSKMQTHCTPRCNARVPSWLVGIVNSTALACISFLGPLMGTPLGLRGLSPQNSIGRKATWAMCPPEILRQLVSGCSMSWESRGWRWQSNTITCHPFFANLYCILLVKDPGFPALEISLISQTAEVLDMRLHWPGETGCEFALNEACSRPQLGRTWCCPCFAQVTYGETQAYICTVRVWVRKRWKKENKEEFFKGGGGGHKRTTNV